MVSTYTLRRCGILLTDYQSYENLIYNKTGFPPSRSYLHTTIEMNHLDVKTHIKKNAWWERNENAARCLEQTLGATPEETIAVRPLSSHLTSYSSKTNKPCGKLLERQGRTHKQCSLMESFIWSCQYWPTSKNLQQFCGDRRCSLEDLPGVMYNKDGWRVRESRWIWCSQRNFMMTIYIIIIIIIMSRWLHGYPWPSLATPPYRSSP